MASKIKYQEMLDKRQTFNMWQVACKETKIPRDAPCYLMLRYGEIIERHATYAALTKSYYWEAAIDGSCFTSSAYEVAIPTPEEIKYLDWASKVKSRFVRVHAGDFRALDRYKTQEGERFIYPTWGHENEYDHGRLAHVCHKDPSKVTYWPDPNRPNYKVTTTPGRYVRKELGFGDRDAQKAATEWEIAFGKVEVHFAKTPDEIERVYVDGPNSCMAGPSECYANSTHPCRIYGDTLLQVAYMKNSAGRVAARALVRPDLKRFGRVYGYSDRLHAELLRMGYKAADLWDYEEASKFFDGVLLPAIRHEGKSDAYIMPYIDGETVAVLTKDGFNLAHEDGEWASENKTYSCHNTGGSTAEGRRCVDCGDWWNNPVNGRMDGDHRWICPSCCGDDSCEDEDEEDF